MKNVLRNASLFIIAIAFTFTFTLDVKADACGDLDNNRCRIGTRGAIKVAGNGFKYQQLSSATSNNREYVGRTYYNTINVSVNFNNNPGNYYFSHYKDSYSSLFCLDAQYEGGSSVNAERFLLDTSESKKVQVFDAAVMSILTDGGVHTGGAGDATYWAKLMAIRAMTYTFGFYNTANKDYLSAFYAGLTVAHNWNEFYASDVAAVNAELAKIGAGSIGSVPLYRSYNYTGDPVNSGAGYYVRGLAAAAEYARKLASQPKVEVSNPQAGEVETSGEEGDVFVKKDVVHTLKLSGFTEQNKFIINSNDNYGIKFAEGTQYDGLTAYISQIEISGGPVLSKDQIPYGQDFVELGYIKENQDVEIKITVHFEGWKSSTNSNIVTLKCGQTPIKYSIDGSYGTGMDEQFGEYIGTVWYAGKKEKQRYVGVERVSERREDDAGTPWESPYETNLIDACSCDDLEEACKATHNPNSDECIELKESNCGMCSWYDVLCEFGDEESCENYTTQCDLKCDTYFKTFECCDERGELIVSTLDDHEVSILGPGEDNPDAPSVKACFVTAVDNMARVSEDSDEKNNAGVEGVKDQKDNTYTLADMKSNSYCTVSCKEDYIMTMPTAKLVNAGRYFTFKAKVEGTKACYTNTIDREKYNKDIVEKQKAIYEAYNGWIRYQTALESNPHNLPTVTECGSCHAWCHGSSCDSQITYIPGATTDQFSYTAYYPEFSEGRNGSGQTLRLNPTTEYGPESDTTQTHTESDVANCTETCSDGNGGTTTCPCEHSCSYTVVDEERDVGYLIKRLTDLRDGYKNALDAAIEDYNQTIKEFNQCSKWDSEINYDPEVYYDYSETDYMNMLNNHIGEMEKDVQTSSTNDWYCNGTTTLNNFKFGQLSDQNYEQCNNSNTSYVEPKMQYVMCSSSKRECYFDPNSYVSEASYKKVTSKVVANYRPATLFYNAYPTGEITTSKADDNVALENKLPVALNRERGIYKYQVKMEKLGEFYDQAPSDNLGRYVGSSTAVVDPTVLDYNCSYLVNITKTTGWVCDFDDDCDDDCIANCIGPNCDDYCDGNDCVADCIGLGCIYDSGAGTSLLEKVVSLNSLFPNGTDSYNWDERRNDKARLTVSEIEGKGNSVYDEEPILSITLTPSSAREIKKYNNSVINDGGYSNKTVSCENRDGFEQIVCYSSFIDDLLAGEFGDVVNDNSLIAEESYRHGSSGYFELWGNAVSEDNMIGPSWK